MRRLECNDKTLTSLRVGKCIPRPDCSTFFEVFGQHMAGYASRPGPIDRPASRHRGMIDARSGSVDFEKLGHCIELGRILICLYLILMAQMD